MENRESGDHKIDVLNWGLAEKETWETRAGTNGSVHKVWEYLISMDPQMRPPRAAQKNQKDQ